MMISSCNASSSPPTFHPTLSQLADWEGFVATMEEAGAHKVGIAKLVLPEGWQPRERGYSLGDLGVEVGKLLTQKIRPQVNHAYTRAFDARASFVNDARIPAQDSRALNAYFTRI